MTASSPAQLGDSHNFGRRVSMGNHCVRKPRTILWEWLVLGADSPLRRAVSEAAQRDGLGADAFRFLPSLRFLPTADGGEVERIELTPLPDPCAESRRDLARIVGQSLALYGWLGISDLHWENLVLGVGADGGVVFGPLDIEMVLSDLSLPTETQLLPDADPEYAAVYRHVCGVRRVLPYLGKPVSAGDLLAMVGSYERTLAFLDRNATVIAAVFAQLPALRETPIRVCLRGTDEYVGALVGPRASGSLGGDRAAPLWPPLLDAESEQMARGDIPYFFRLYGRPGIHYYGDQALTQIKTLPLEGDVPQLAPLLRVSRGLRSPSRKTLRTKGLFTVLGAFDHPSLAGRHGNDELSVTFKARTLIVQLASGEELEVRRDLSPFVGSVYLPCGCGEVRSVFVPPVTVCEASR